MKRQEMARGYKLFMLAPAHHLHTRVQAITIGHWLPTDSP
jgi:hypothetical protein